MIPDKIYIAETPNKLIEIWSDEPVEPKPYIKEHCYIRKDALLEWATTNRDKLDVLSDNDAVRWGQRNAFQQMIDKLNSL